VRYREMQLAVSRLTSGDTQIFRTLEDLHKSGVVSLEQLVQYVLLAGSSGSRGVGGGAPVPAAVSATVAARRETSAVPRAAAGASAASAPPSNAAAEAGTSAATSSVATSAAPSSKTKADKTR